MPCRRQGHPPRRQQVRPQRRTRRGGGWRPSVPHRTARPRVTVWGARGTVPFFFFFRYPVPLSKSRSPAHAPRAAAPAAAGAPLAAGGGGGLCRRRRRDGAPAQASLQWEKGDPAGPTDAAPNDRLDPHRDRRRRRRPVLHRSRHGDSPRCLFLFAPRPPPPPPPPRPSSLTPLPGCRRLPPKHGVLLLRRLPGGGEEAQGGCPSGRLRPGGHPQLH